MLRVDYRRHGQTVQDLYQLSIRSAHTRTRERFAALVQVAQGTSSAQVAPKLGRLADTVRDWIKRYNERGPQALLYVHTGGTLLLCLRSRPPHQVRNGCYRAWQAGTVDLASLRPLAGP